MLVKREEIGPMTPYAHCTTTICRKAQNLNLRNQESNQAQKRTKLHQTWILRGTQIAILFQELSDFNFVLDPPRNTYLLGWGHNCRDSQTVIGSWSFSIPDVYNAPTTFTYDIIEGDTPLLLGLDYSVTLIVTT